MEYTTRTTAYSLLKEKLVSLSCEEECQIVQKLFQTLQKESRRKGLWLFYLVKMKMTAWCSQHQKIFIGNSFKIFRK